MSIFFSSFFIFCVSSLRSLTPNVEVRIILERGIHILSMLCHGFSSRLRRTRGGQKFFILHSFLMKLWDVIQKNQIYVVLFPEFL